MRALVSMVMVGSLLAAGCGPEPEQGTPFDGEQQLQGKADSPWLDSTTMKPYAFEISATKAVPGLSKLSIPDKKKTVGLVADLLSDRVGKRPYVKTLVGQNGMERLDFPPIDRDMDGTPDEVAQKLELTFHTDPWFLWLADRARGLALRWSVVVYTDGDSLKVVLGVPDTFVRVYFRGEPYLPVLRSWARWNHRRLRDLVHHALKSDGFKTRVNQGLQGTELDEATIQKIEQQMGALTAESIAPSLTIPGQQITVAQVVNAVEAAFTAKRVPDLNGDGVVDAGDQAVLPTAMMSYLQGQMSQTELQAMLGQGFSLWQNGGTFQQWAHPRTLKLGSVHVIELCQPFYAGTALSTGLYHIPSMPCAVSVWREGPNIRVNLLDPDIIFAYFFRDGGSQMPPAMQQLFAVFPTFVFNEMAGILNAAMDDLGVTQHLVLHAFPTQP